MFRTYFILVGTSQDFHVNPISLAIFSKASYTGWVYYYISNVMQYSNTALETTALVMYDHNTFFYVVPLFLMALRIS